MITQEETIILAEQLRKCIKHRKEYFFNSSKCEIITDSQKIQFKEDIKTFSNGQNERLCYRIHVDEVKIKLVECTGVHQFDDLKDYQVCGVSIFAHMKTADFDRLKRVLNEYKSSGSGLLKAAINLANDFEFSCMIKSTDDIVSIAEAIYFDKDVFINVFLTLNYITIFFYFETLFNLI